MTSSTIKQTEAEPLKNEHGRYMWVSVSGICNNCGREIFTSLDPNTGTVYGWFHDDTDDDRCTQEG